jgi:hypothetical protein
MAQLGHLNGLIDAGCFPHSFNIFQFLLIESLIFYHDTIEFSKYLDILQEFSIILQLM